MESTNSDEKLATGRGPSEPSQVTPESPSRPRARFVSDSGPSRDRSHTPSGGRVAKSHSMSLSWASNTPSPATGADPRPFALSPEVTDRVFPVRSVVSVDPAVAYPALTQPQIERRRSNSTRKASRAVSIASDPCLTQSQPPDGPPHDPCQPVQSSNSNSRRSSGRTVEKSLVGIPPREREHSILGSTSLNSESTSRTNSTTSTLTKPESVRAPSLSSLRPVTARFRHVVTDGGHAVVTGLEGDTVQTCEDEPIHIPGAIQSFGLLIALREEADNLVVRVVSENSAKLIGYAPQQLFQLTSFLNILTDEQADNVLDHLDFIRDGGTTDPAVHGPEVFMLSIRKPSGRTVKCWCAMHIPESNKDLILCEMELEDDVENPLTGGGETTPEPPEDTLGSNPTPEEFAESTVNASRPLRVLRSARKKKGEAAAMEVFNIMAQVQEQLANATNLAQFLKILIGVVKELTGFHRVMAYQFDQQFNGRVVAELVDPRATKDLYMGLHFPASDIPRQARDLYRVNKVRLLYDRDQETSRLVGRTIEDLEQPLDMTFAYLRAMSPIHIKYLANMAVRSSMSISINAFDELWGLVACHSYGQKGMRVSFPIRKMCRLVGDTASRNIERLSYASRLQARKLINTACTSKNPSGYIVASSEDLLYLFSADLGAISIREETKLLGKAEDNVQELLALLEYLRLRKIDTVYASSNITTDFPDLRYPPGFKSIAGLLFVPLSASGGDFIVLFRKSSAKEVKWAGNPYEKFVKEGTEGYLEPRKSFRTWREVIHGTCRDWTEEEIETAAVLCLVYGKFIEVWRQKEAALQHSQLQRILLANSAHEVRTPLNAIINYLEIALEGNLDRDVRENLSRSHSASRSLVYVINDLLDLTKTEQGLDLVKEEVFHFPTMLHEATEPFRGDARRKGIDYHVTILEGIPSLLSGDPGRIRQVISNLIANAIQNTSSGGVEVHVSRSVEQLDQENIDIEFVIEDSGAGMPQKKVDALFIELEQVTSEHEALDSAISDQSGVTQAAAIEAGQATLGLGLAVVARAVRNMNGQLRVRTEAGKGSRFAVQLTMGIPPLADPMDQSGHKSQERIVSEQSALGLENAGNETLLIDGKASQPSWNMSTHRRGSQESVESLKSKHSGQSTKSVTSFRSARSMTSLRSAKSATSIRSARNEVDRLIDDIQKPHLVPDRERTDGRRRQLSSARLRPASADDDLFSPPALSSPSAGRSHDTKVRGEQSVTNSRTPIKPIRISDGDSLGLHRGVLKSPPKVAFQLEGVAADLQTDGLDPNNMSILVAEDDPINSKIMKKRLEKLGHTVHLTVNGEECSDTHCEGPSHYDVVLMDLQMPIVDGFASTKMIRAFEKIHGQNCLSARANPNGRIPIFAVSASLLEKERMRYIDGGFDGWILKPVNFQRVDGLLKGIVQEATRSACIYQAGQWELGGWFGKRPADPNASTSEASPSERAPTNSLPESDSR